MLRMKSGSGQARKVRSKAVPIASDPSRKAPADKGTNAERHCPSLKHSPKKWIGELPSMAVNISTNKEELKQKISDTTARKKLWSIVETARQLRHAGLTDETVGAEVGTALRIVFGMHGSVSVVASACESAIHAVRDFVAHHGHDDENQSPERAAARQHALLTPLEWLMLFEALEKVLGRALLSTRKFHKCGFWGTDWSRERSSLDESAKLCYASDYLIKLQLHQSCVEASRRSNAHFKYYRVQLSIEMPLVGPKSKATVFESFRTLDLPLTHNLTYNLFVLMGAVISQMNIDELASFSSTVTARDMKTGLMREAKTRALCLLLPETKPFTRGLLVVGFGGDWGHVDTKALAVHELVELLLELHTDSPLRENLETECRLRLAGDTQWFGFHHLSELQDSPRTNPGLQQAIVAHVVRTLDALGDDWPGSALRLLVLLPKQQVERYGYPVLKRVTRVIKRTVPVFHDIGWLLTSFPKSSATYEAAAVVFNELMTMRRPRMPGENDAESRELDRDYMMQPPSFSVVTDSDKISVQIRHGRRIVVSKEAKKGCTAQP